MKKRISTNKTTMLNFKEKWDNVAKLVIYAKILIEKRDFMGASLIACKAHDLLALSEQEIDQLRQSDEEFNKLDLLKGKDFNAVKRIQFILKKYYTPKGKDLNNSGMTEIIWGAGEGETRKTISDLRNALIHKHSDFTSPEFKSDTDELVDRLFSLPFVEENLKETYSKNISCNYEVERDLIREIGIIDQHNEPPIISKSYTIKNEIFEDLLLARKYIFPLLRQLLSKKLQSPYLDCTQIQISKVDSTSAYVWLSIPIKTPEIPQKLRTRPKMYLPTLSVLMTPLEFLVYIDFGGFSYYYRVKYYNYILNKDRFIELMNNMMTHQDAFFSSDYACLRNVHWYVFQNHIIDIKMINMDRFNDFYTKFEQKMKGWLEEKREPFHSSVELEKPITWNISLVGWKYPYIVFEDQNISVDQFIQTIQRNVNSLAPVLKYLTTVKKPFKKSKNIICKEYNRLLS